MHQQLCWRLQTTSLSRSTMHARTRKSDGESQRTLWRLRIRSRSRFLTVRATSSKVTNSCARAVEKHHLILPPKRSQLTSTEKPRAKQAEVAHVAAVLVQEHRQRQ